MPIYEYKCDHCDHQFELLQKFSDAPLRTCPSCGKNSVRKLVSAAAFHLKGSGWYVTDFRDKSKAGKEKTRSGDPGAGSTETKVEPAKTEAKPKAEPGASGTKTTATSANSTATKPD